MALWLDSNDYEFYSENEKLEFIMETRCKRLYICPTCSEAHFEVEDAYNCCTGDCYEQEKEFVIEERADERLRSEKGD